jgi:hypothetical protein
MLRQNQFDESRIPLGLRSESRHERDIAAGHRSEPFLILALLYPFFGHQSGFSSKYWTLL